MKTINDIKEEMNDIQVSLSTSSGLKPSQVSKLKKRYEFLKICRSYLETNPAKDFLVQEKDRLSNKINLINAGYVPNQKLIEAGLRKEEQAEHKDYNKIMSMPKERPATINTFSPYGLTSPFKVLGVQKLFIARI